VSGSDQRKRRERWEQERAQPNYNYNGMGKDPEVVRTVELAPVIRAWVVKYLREQTGTTGKVAYGVAAENDITGPWEILSSRTGINVRRLSLIVNEDESVPYISLTQAEKLLIEIEQQHLLATGEVRVIPNPRWSVLRWVKFMAERGCA
jgi:hypothetical protein